MLRSDPPTAKQLDRAFGLRPGTVTLDRPTRWPRPNDPFRLLATMVAGGRGNWRVRLEPALPSEHGRDVARCRHGHYCLVNAGHLMHPLTLDVCDLGAKERSMGERWRTGRKVGRTIYRQLGLEPSDDDPLIGVMDTPELAKTVVIAVNRLRGWGEGDG